MFPRAYVVEVSTPVVEVDPFNNEITKPGPFEPLQVVGWLVGKVQESTGDSVLRTIDELTVYSPTPVDPAASIRLPDGSRWRVEGNSQDYNHGPWWAPGVFVVTARKTEG